MSDEDIQSRFIFNNNDGEVDVFVSVDKNEWEINPLDKDTYKPPNGLTTNIEYGDVFQLGCHRLMCGDSTNSNDVCTLMDGERADITFSSPPYNTGGGGGYAFDKLDPEKYDFTYYNKDGIYNKFNDALTDDEYSYLLVKSSNLGLEYTDVVLYNMGVLKGNKRGLIDLLYNMKYNLCDILVWDKGNNALPYGLPSQKSMVKHDAEFIFCFNKKGNRSFNHSQWKIGTKTNIIRCKNNSRNKFKEYHRAVFPLEFALEIVSDFCEDSVLDLFGGVGTTLIASESCNKKAYIMEIDPLYCQIIINRWEEFTGEKSVKLEKI